MIQRTVESLIARYGDAYKWYATGTVMLGCIATVLSATMVNVALPDIMGEFGMGQDKVQWLSTAFLASMTATMLVTAWSIATFGPCLVYSAVLMTFVIGSVLGGLSTSDDMLIVARVIQGSAAGLVQPVAMLIIFRAFPPHQRGMAMGIYGIGVVLAPAVGPTLGGMLIDNYSWRYVFFLPPPFCIVGFLLAPAFLPGRSGERPQPFDWLGFLLLSVSLASFLAALANGQRKGWDSDFVTWGFLLAAGCAVAFVVQERRVRSPILALNVFYNFRFAAASAVAFSVGMGLFGSTYLIPLFVQTIQAYMPTESGLLLMPAGIALGVVFPLAGRLSDFMPAHLLIMFGLFLFGLSSYLVSAVDTSTCFWDLACWVAIGRIGLGSIMPALNAGALRVLNSTQVGQGAGIINFVRQLGGAVGVCMLSVYLERHTALWASEFNALQTGVHGAAEALDIVALLLSKAGIVDNVSVAVRTDEAYRFFSQIISAQASVMGFRESFLLVAVIFLVTLIPAWLMRSERKR